MRKHGILEKPGDHQVAALSVRGLNALMLAQVHTGGKNRARSAGRPRRRRRVRLARNADSRFLPIGIIEAPVFPSTRRQNREDGLGAPRFPRSKARDRDGIPFSKTHVDTLREKTGIVGRVSEHYEPRCARRGSGGRARRRGRDGGETQRGRAGRREDDARSRGRARNPKRQGVREQRAAP